MSATTTSVESNLSFFFSLRRIMSFNGETIMHILEGLTPEERAYPVVFEDSEHPDVSYSIDQVTVTKQGWIFLKSDK